MYSIFGLWGNYLLSIWNMKGCKKMYKIYRFNNEEATSYLAELNNVNPEVHLMALLAYQTGARLSELFKLRKSDINNTHVLLGKRIYKGTGRYIVLKADTAMLLKDLIAEKKNNDLVFSSSLKDVQKAIAQVNDALSFQNCSFRSFRHTFTKRLFRNIDTSDPCELQMFLEMIGFNKVKIKNFYEDTNVMNFRQFEELERG